MVRVDVMDRVAVSVVLPEGVMDGLGLTEIEVVWDCEDVMEVVADEVGLFDDVTLCVGVIDRVSKVVAVGDLETLLEIEFDDVALCVALWDPVIEEVGVADGVSVGDFSI